MKLDLKDEEGRPRKGIEQYIGVIARDRGIELKTLKKMLHDRDQNRKWKNGQTLKENGKGKKEEEEEITYE